MISEDKFNAVAKNVSEMKDALLGNPMRGEPGIIQGHHRMMEDLYGIRADGSVDKESKKNCLLTRQSRSEDKQNKVFWIFSGIVAAITAAKIGVSALIAKMFDR